MKLLTIGDPDLNEICKKYECKLDDIYVIADLPKRMIYKKLKLKNVFYINDANDINEYKRILKEIGMKFDKVIMNPPYEKNLHLKIVEEVLNNTNGEFEVVNLSPVRWLQDPLAEIKKNSDYNKYKDTIISKIESISLYDQALCNKLFGIGLLQPLGLYKINNKGGYKLNKNSILQKVYNKIISEDNFNKQNVIKYNDNLKNYVCTNIMAPPMKYGRPMFNALKQFGCFKGGANNYKRAKENCSSATRGDVSNTDCVVFNTYNEALNCYNAFNTTFAKYICMCSVVDVNVVQKYLPWMQDYTQPWTNERFYEYFNITEDEQKIIEETMAQYETN